MTATPSAFPERAGIYRIGNLDIFRYEEGGGSGHFVNELNRLVW